MDHSAIFWRLEHLPVYHDSRGDLSVIESVSDRAQFFRDFKLWGPAWDQINQRFTVCVEELLVALSGQWILEIKGPCGERASVHLKTPECGVWVAPRSSYSIQSLDSNAVLLQVLLGKEDVIPC
jgi:hypothetical protein